METKGEADFKLKTRLLSHSCTSTCSVNSFDGFTSGYCITFSI